MEPFYLRCETCQARLRVRDERFLGQVQSCPKCGSMVHILAPPAEAVPNPEAAAAAAAATTISARLLASWRDHSLAWIAGAAATSAVGALAIVLALRGDDRQVAALSPAVPAVAEQIATPIEIVKDELPPAVEEKTKDRTVETPPQVEQVAAADVPADATPPIVAPPSLDSAPVVSHEKPRTLTLEPVPDEPRTPTAKTNADPTPDYPPASEIEISVPAAEPPAARRPARVTNVIDQFSVPIESIDLPSMPIGEFVNLVSGMAAVPIQLDPKVLGDVGLSSRSTVTVRSENTTVGKLLERVLKEHQLACEVQDGALVVVRAKR